MSDPTLARLRRLLLVIPAAARASHAGGTLSLQRACKLAGARSERELVEDLAALEELYGAPEFEGDDPVSVFVEDGEIEVAYARGLESPLALSLAEGAMLLGALAPFEEAGGPAVRGAARKLRKAIPAPLRPEADQLARGVEVAAPPTSPFLAPLRDAAERRVEVTVEYRSVADAELARRTLEPRLVFQREGAWYLAAFDVQQEEEHLYRLDRVAAVELGARTFAAHRGPDPARYGRRRLFFESGAERDVTLRLTGAPARLARRRGGGRVTPNPDGSATVVKRMTPGNHLAAVVLGHGGDVSVIAPPEVREDLRRRVTELRGLYGEGAPER